MAETILGLGFCNHLVHNSDPQFEDGLIHHWLGLQSEREPAIQEVQRIIKAMKPTPPYYCCKVANLERIKKVDFDFGGKKPIGLVPALYSAVTDGQITYDSNGQIIAACPGKNIISPPFIWEGRGHYIVDSDQVVTLTPKHPAAKVYEITKAILQLNGLVWAEDNVFLLSLMAGESTLNRQLLESLGLVTA